MIVNPLVLANNSVRSVLSNLAANLIHAAISFTLHELY